MEKCVGNNKGWACIRKQCASAWRIDRGEDQNSNIGKVTFSRIYCTTIGRNRQQKFAE